METHAIFQELSGKGNGLVKIFLQDDRQLAAEDLCVCVCGYGNDSVRMELRALLSSLLLRWWSTSNSTNFIRYRGKVSKQVIKNHLWLSLLF